uniref:Glutamate receptor 1 n=1 Tax=Adineta vaga TaxID=104782 RepID=UPI0002B63D07|nr:Chain A, Glutamate receptor 1 [Adineta vaga]4IO2_B Chain B, Glutamate receptor 1 [Adineta vaga]4IO3_A Chain A, AvGluR1 ligand binding domain [Adineta vaga]4IO3_B Chain B, AvGluR1 ligand binding domain [Adineta vaga]4IO4_A Chain A, AvGluR1 ligand binding domain [Adineta vaga]4IO4_B Chain B, AvGluR1 ligand binding domain [Adineta vaga]4IO5_A Chain A, AvGluR1 ligand binding domain [Adineta vaga]4IO5_B Chain B, AvGluR1 ligand binding domain [Adineta vaga]4IO6_A Chain A, AvGluR1 ligand bindin
GSARLKGITLRIGVIESVPFTIVANVIDTSGRNTTKLTGYVLDLIEYLRDKMGFVADVQLAPPNTSYTGLVLALANGDYDIAIGDITVTSARREIVAFSNSISDNSMRILMRKGTLIDGMDDLKNGKIPYNRIGIRIGTAGEDYYLREISGGSRNFYPLKSRQEMYDSLLAGIIDVSFMDIGTAEYVTNNIYCNLTLVGEDFDKSTFGIVTPKEWLYAKDLDVNILSLRETGILDNLKKKWFQTKACP